MIRVRAVVASLVVIACGSSTEAASGSSVTGTWRARTERNGIQLSAVWRFGSDGRVDAFVQNAANGVTTTTCRANTIDTSWEDRGTKLAIRFGSQTGDYLYELTEGGSRLRVEPGVDIGGEILNTYERADDVTTDCRGVDAGP